MTSELAAFLRENVSLWCCPKCEGELAVGAEDLRCLACAQAFPVSDDIPQLFWPDESTGPQDLTQVVKEFYEETPFPDYDDFDSLESFRRKASRGVFAQALDEQVPAGTRILECGCGTGQLSNFLSIANRTVFATDMCMNSLRLGQRFARQHQLRNAHFIQMNLLRPTFRPGSFHLVISNGVLMTTRDPFRTFQTIGRLVKPGGYILIGLYHRYGRLATDARRLLFRVTGDRFTWVDPLLRNERVSEAKKRAWFADQYKHPHEVKHTIGDALRWFRRTGFEFVRSIPRSRPFHPYSREDALFDPEKPGNWLERLVVELGMIRDPSHDGGFFVAIGRKPVPS
jgi:SAM-dependent methyltransferase